MARTSDDMLADYRRKRNFSRTSEPAGKRARKGGRSFVIQKHAARRTHFDFRLEHDGVLKSWAVTRGLSLDPGDKRLAVRTEDHPLDYGGFEGVIPDGSYGAGPVMLWDRGTWEPINDPDDGLADGDLKFRLHGEHLQGEWVLVRMRNKGEKRENWLLIKKADDHAKKRGDVTEQFRTSVKTGRTMDAIAKGRAAKTNKPARKSGGGKKISASSAAPPDFIKPQLATLVDEPPEGDEWLHEIKYDGYRTLTAISGDEVRFYTRSGQNWTRKFSTLIPTFQALGLDQTLIDGEIVVFDDKGRSRFSLLQQALKDGGGSMSFMAFDLLVFEGRKWRSKPLLERKRQLAKILKSSKGAVRYSDHIEGDGEKMRIKACEMALEGIISKRADAAYRSGRNTLWLKSKCVGRDEYVIGGWTPSKAAGRPFASLLVGEYDRGELIYRGRVGTGFDGAEMAALASTFEKLARKTSPFHSAPEAIARSARWVAPDLIAEIAYTERTSDGLLRHPAYLGLRSDKPAKSVKATTMPEIDRQSEFAGVKLSSPDKILFPEQGVSKRDLAAYLVEMADHILPHIARRPMSLVRCPDGYEDGCFFQKHSAAGFPDEIKRIAIREKSGKKADYLHIDDAAGLAAAAQMGVLELHIWGAHIDDVEKPDRMVFDLDPADDVPFADVKRAARDLRGVLDAAGLKSFPLLTGGKGIHLVVPLERRQPWDTVKRFSSGLARLLSASEPERFIAKSTKAERQGRIFIDWLRNERGATAIAPYSPRARKGAPVAVPVSWNELPRIDSANAYTMDTVRTRLKRLKNDPWGNYSGTKQSISDDALEFVEKGGTQK